MPYSCLLEFLDLWRKQTRECCHAEAPAVPTLFKHCLHRTSTRNAWQGAVGSGIGSVVFVAIHHRQNGIYYSFSLPSFFPHSSFFTLLSLMLGTELRVLYFLSFCLQPDYRVLPPPPSPMTTRLLDNGFPHWLPG